MTAAVHAFSIPPVVKVVTVACDLATAFEVFTDQIGRWYPIDRFSVKPAVDCRIEPHVGGLVFETNASGEKTLWGHVLEWSPPHAVAIAWHARASAEEAQRVEVSFRSVSDGTEVKLVHTGWEHLKIDAREWRDKYDRGWIEIFERRYKAFADRATHLNSESKTT